MEHRKLIMEKENTKAWEGFFLEFEKFEDLALGIW